MIEYKKGNLFLEKDVDVYVNPVNCVGAMGAGLAAQFKTRYPNMFAEYKNVCKRKEISVGHCHYWKHPLSGIIVVNFPTKIHWKDSSKIEYVEEGLKDLSNYISNNFIMNFVNKMVIPALGCGLGGLDWKEVKPLMEQYLANVGKKIIIFESI